MPVTLNTFRPTSHWTTSLSKKHGAQASTRPSKEAVNAARDEDVRKRKQMRILEAFGTISVDPAYDYKAERQRNAGTGRGSRRSRSDHRS
jgi:hypothetical protein